jgi:hypothetical protein
VWEGGKEGRGTNANKMEKKHGRKIKRYRNIDISKYAIITLQYSLTPQSNI